MVDPRSDSFDFTRATTQELHQFSTQIGTIGAACIAATRPCPTRYPTASGARRTVALPTPRLATRLKCARPLQERQITCRDDPSAPGCDPRPAGERRSVYRPGFRDAVDPRSGPTSALIRPRRTRGERRSPWLVRSAAHLLAVTRHSIRRWPRSRIR